LETRDDFIKRIRWFWIIRGRASSLNHPSDRRYEFSKSRVIGTYDTGNRINFYRTHGVHSFRFDAETNRFFQYERAPVRTTSRPKPKRVSARYREPAVTVNGRTFSGRRMNVFGVCGAREYYAQTYKRTVI